MEAHRKYQSFKVKYWQRKMGISEEMGRGGEEIQPKKTFHEGGVDILEVT